MRYKVPEYVVVHFAAEHADYDDLKVYIDYQPAEYDTNTAEGLEVTEALYNGRDIIDALSDRDIKELAEDALCALHEDAQDYYEGDG